MRNRYKIDTLISVDLKEIVRIGGKVIKIYKGVIYRENFRVSPFKKVIDEVFELRQKYKDGNIYVMQLLVKLLLHCLYREQIRKEIEKSYQCKSEF